MTAGLAGLYVGLPDCPALLDTYTSKRKNRDACREVQKRVVALAGEGRVPVIVLASRWANLGSPVRAPGDGSKPKTLYDSASGEVKIDFAKALARTVAQLRATGARVVVVGPTPEVEYDVPRALLRAAQLGHHPLAPAK